MMPLHSCEDGFDQGERSCLITHANNVLSPAVICKLSVSGLLCVKTRAFERAPLPSVFRGNA